MNTQLLAWIQSAGIFLLALICFFLGKQISTWSGRKWMWGFFIPFFGIVLMLIPRYNPSFETVIPFKWIMKGRSEFVWITPICALSLSTLLFQLKHKREQFIITIFILFFISYFSIAPFLMPVFAYQKLTHLKTKIDSNGICLQETDYTCGPAAAVTLLSQYNITASEGDLSIAAFTTRMAGTPPDLLCEAIQKKHGVTAHVQYNLTLEKIKNKTPFLAIIKYAPLVDHYVVVFKITDTQVFLGDPLTGKRSCPRNEFLDQWRRVGVWITP